MKKKYLLSLIVVLMLSVFVGCSSNEAPPADQGQEQQEAPVAEVTEFQYISAADLEAALTAGSDEYVVLDVRKKADYDTEHIKGSVSADVDSKVSEEKDEQAQANIAAALDQVEIGDKKVVLLCYSGKRYAQAATNYLAQAGVDPAQIYTLDGGYKGWTNTDLLEK